MICLLIVATNKYTEYLPALIESVRKYFPCDICLFTNKDVDVKVEHICKVRGDAWPYPTLYRYHFFKAYQNKIKDYDHYFYIDADTIIKSHLGDVLSERTAVTHCGYVGRRGTYESNPLSTSYVGPNEGTTYYGGGFWGFSNKEFWKFIHEAVAMIEIDERKDITPVWHDESVLNRYLINNPPTKVLSPSYHYPEGNEDYYKKIWGRDYECKILLLDKTK